MGGVKKSQEEESEQMEKEKENKMKHTRTELNWITMTKRKKSTLKHPPHHQSPPPAFFIYIPHLMVSLISFRWISITAITAQYSSHALWNHSRSLCFSVPSTFFVYLLLNWFRFLSWSYCFFHENIPYQRQLSLCSWC